jgi:hypothetical protein
MPAQLESMVSLAAVLHGLGRPVTSSGSTFALHGYGSSMPVWFAQLDPADDVQARKLLPASLQALQVWAEIQFRRSQRSLRRRKGVEMLIRIRTAAEHKTLRYKILHAAARITRGARRRQLRIKASWPWVADIVTAWNRISALAQAP